ncbi:UDP-N-acetylenolpyruvoylglucosamine reductase [Nocardioides baekrokdamisoli]|uniref:UDP-N-acetylenolpyruvoylglucosamine reductase n=1 Tax=Nocardioides baekrokdamisoli TaxID=1804624 RepID=A0A3G9IF30_9ACTN|nr:UDP-N-acetylmuramate dehydrogenase [Nocardioides baekrokdamisoli]BBH16986.1 UDP-N-acetylenolpyruvoylglucosamine reductase [Nocardioides baekrokdamisoli]
MPRLADFTTLRLGGSASTWIEASSEAAFISALGAADEAGTGVLILGGGSNLVVADEGFDGTVVRVATAGIAPEVDADGHVRVTVAAGENWDTFVAHAVASGWVGVEALAGIPGTVGATPMQNVGAYGQEVGQTIAEVRVWDRRLKGVRTFAADECGFAYRWSRFKADPGRHAVLSVTFTFAVGSLSAPVGYAELARTLDVEVGERAPLEDVRAAVLGLRRGKGMVLDAEDHDTWSAGSFFTNPFVEVAPAGAPAYPQPDGRVKTSAAWLIEHAGFGKGYGNELVSLSTKHTLALTNRGGATTDALLALAREIRDGVAAEFGIGLEPEPVFLGCAL